MDQQALYRDIAGRTDGDIYIGVVGPVRTGKSTFIKRFMEMMVLPNIAGEHRRERAVDELPQSGAGRTIMTTQPKFVPNEAVEVQLKDQATFKVRLVDCVGYLIRGVLGTQEGEEARMVRTPWYDHDIPFEEAAELGTRQGDRRAFHLGGCGNHRRQHNRDQPAGLCGGRGAGGERVESAGQALCHGA